MNPNDDKRTTPSEQGPDPRPPYEPPRITKRRSVVRATLFTGATATGPSAIGIAVNPP